jgi:hypothetical protein
LQDCGVVQNRRGTTLRFHPDPQIFGNHGFRPAVLYRMARSKAYLFRGLEIRWSCDPSLPRPEGVPAEARLHFPGGLGDFLAASLDNQAMLTPKAFIGEAELPEGGRVEWAVAWPEDEEAAFSHSYCNTIPTAEGGTHEAGLKSALLRGLKAKPRNGSHQLKRQGWSTMRSRIISTIGSAPIRAPPGNYSIGLSSAPRNGSGGASSANSRAKVRPANCGYLVSSPTAPATVLPAPKFFWSRATAPAVPQSRRAIAKRRRSCRCAARS